VNDDALGFVGVSIVAASSREEALALVQADLDEHENESPSMNARSRRMTWIPRECFPFISGS